jgi:hypothetical protein
MPEWNQRVSEVVLSVALPELSSLAGKTLHFCCQSNAMGDPARSFYSWLLSSLLQNMLLLTSFERRLSLPEES